MPEISIIVPIYKVEEYLPRCIDSILAQTFIDFELLLIDDGSPDRSGLLCDAYAEKDERIRVFHKENGGVSSARNCGLDHFTGNYVSFIDADDVIHPRFLEILYQNAGESTVPFCQFCDFSEPPVPWNDMGGPISAEQIGIARFTDHNLAFSVVTNKLFHKTVIRDHRFHPEYKNGEDTLFAYETLSSACQNVVWIKAALYGYYHREDSAVGTIDDKGQKECFDVMRLIYTAEKKKTDHCGKLRNEWICRAISFFYATQKGNASHHKESRKAVFKELSYILSGKFDLMNRREKFYLVFSLLFR